LQPFAPTSNNNISNNNKGSKGSDNPPPYKPLPTPRPRKQGCPCKNPITLPAATLSSTVVLLLKQKRTAATKGIIATPAPTI